MLLNLARTAVIVASFGLYGCVSFYAVTRNVVRFCEAGAVDIGRHSEPHLAKRLPLYSWTVSKGPDHIIHVMLTPPPGKPWAAVGCLIEPQDRDPDPVFFVPFDEDA